MYNLLYNVQKFVQRRRRSHSDVNTSGDSAACHCRRFHRHALQVLQTYTPGWFVLPVPLLIVIYLFTLIPRVMNGLVIHETMQFMPRIGMNFDVYIDGLGLLFAILISGIGALVVLY